MDEKKQLKGVRLKNEKLSWFNKQDNGSEATRKAIENQMRLEEENINLEEAINFYNKLKDEFEDDISFHFKRALKIYNEYLKQINNVDIKVDLNKSEKEKDISDENRSKQDENKSENDKFFSEEEKNNQQEFLESKLNKLD